MNWRRGRPLARAAAAVASGGATAAPRISAAFHGIPSDDAIHATAKAVATTNTVEVIRMPRRSRRMAFLEVVRLSQNSRPGRNSSSTTSEGM